MDGPFSAAFSLPQFSHSERFAQPKFYIQGKPSKIGGKMGFRNYFSKASLTTNKARKCM